ncbi:MAG: DUF4156 domain-containing protein [Gammaproteobacteria bacterium]|nr:DUF4156 domain-containing protein [Gammaproteobacteria bacterium]
MKKLTAGHPRALYLLICVAPLLAHCTWVKPTPDSEKVRLVPADRVADCRLLGDVTTSTVDKVIIKRGAAKVKSELETLARMEAAKMNADTIVATSEVVQGRQTFNAYRCRRDAG